MNLFVVCAVAFVAVMLLLGSLAAVIAGLTALFPSPHVPSGPAVDAHVLAAIHSAVGVHFEGARVIHVEEIASS